MFVRAAWSLIVVVSLVAAACARSAILVDGDADGACTPDQDHAWRVEAQNPYDLSSSVVTVTVNATDDEPYELVCDGWPGEP